MRLTQQHRVRPLDPTDEVEIDLVAQRMRLTLIEVLGEAEGGAMYSMEWLRDRVRWHLDSKQCLGGVFLIESDGLVCGHTIVRVESEADGTPVGLFSTIFVVPACRRLGFAETLLDEGEAWFRSHHLRRFATNTSATNDALIRLFEKRGYAIVLRVPETQMVRLAKTLE